MMPALRGILILAACLLALAEPASALEKASAQTVRERSTSSLEQVSSKPLFVFSMRGRPDPFMAYGLMTGTARVDAFSISLLRFNGLVEVQGRSVALFQDTAGKAYVLKGDRLHAPDGRLQEGVRGRIGADMQVTLEQGERRINFTAKRASKRLDGPSQR